MFGDEMILGQGTVKLDSKGRIFIPAHTLAEENDKIILEAETNGKEATLRLHIYQKYNNILQRFINLRNNATSLEDFLRYEAEIAQITQKLDYVAKVDSQRRMIIPKKVLSSLSWDQTKEIAYQGLGTYLELSQKK